MNAETKPAAPEPKATNEQILDTWAIDPAGPVALHLKQKLLPVEGDGGVIFPPTYADIGYNVDTLSDGTRVATIDSVGSQANRLEPMFKVAADGRPENPLAKLVPQIWIILWANDGHTEKRSIFDVAHRAADAIVRSSPTLGTQIDGAFRALHQKGDAGPLCALVPTSLVFGVWDSRGDTGEKRPRLVRSVIRAWDVDPLHSAAQFSSVWKALDESQRSELEKEAKARKVRLSTKGLADAPATFRKVGTSAAKYVQEFRDGAPNPERRVLGGVLAKGRIEREVTVNLVALRGLRGTTEEETKWIRKYLLGLSLLAATADIDLFLREGCHLRYAGEDAWYAVPRRGVPDHVDLGSVRARALLQTYATTAAKHFEDKWPKTLDHRFDLIEAKKLLAKTGEDEPVEAV